MKHPVEVGGGVRFERIRRITGYLAGDVRHFNDAKKAEVRDRVKHTGSGSGGRGADRAAGT